MTSRIITVPRRQTPAAVPVAVITPGTAAAHNATPVSGDDPVFAAIEQHRAAVKAWLAENDSVLSAQLLNAEREAFITWLTTPPTTLGGMLATLSYASRRAYNGSDYVNLAETTLYLGGDGSSDIVTAGEAFPAMIAAALRKLGAS
jgi:hypothetical protein